MFCFFLNVPVVYSGVVVCWISREPIAYNIFQQLSHEKNTSYFPLYCLFNRDLTYIGDVIVTPT